VVSSQGNVWEVGILIFIHHDERAQLPIDALTARLPAIG
jgi:hypothetical protein